MNKCIQAIFLAAFASSVFAQDVMSMPQDGSDDFAMSQDSTSSVVNSLPTQSVPEHFITPSSPQAKPEVLLIPMAEIKTSYTGKTDLDAIFMLNRAINQTQIQFKNENEFVLISKKQTVDRIQVFLAHTVQNKLTGCGVVSDLKNEAVEIRAGQEKFQTQDYLYTVDLGVSRLMINRTLFGASISGEAEAHIIENGRLSKKIQVSSFGGGKVALDKVDSEGGESDVELKLASSQVVDFLANKLGDKLCNYFN